jgi:hypothetical protein
VHDLVLVLVLVLVLDGRCCDRELRKSSKGFGVPWSLPNAALIDKKAIPDV